jgi:hypothetical protein
LQQKKCRKLHHYLCIAINKTSSSSSSTHYSPRLAIGLSNCSPSRSIFSYLHLVPASRSAQIITAPEGVLHYVYLDAVSISELVYPSGLRLLWPTHCHFSMLVLCAMSVTLVFCRIHLISDSILQRNPEHSSFHS